MKLYASTVVNGQEGWGDGIPTLFFTEYLWQTQLNTRVWLYDGGNQGTCLHNPPWRHRDHIEKPYWIEEWLDEFPRITDFDAVLATHYMHPLKEAPIMPTVRDTEYGGWLPPGDYEGVEKFKTIRCHNDVAWLDLIRSGWRPSFPILLSKPDLPPKFVAMQLRRKDGTDNGKPGRCLLEGDEFDEWARGFVAKVRDQAKVPVVSLSDQVGNEDVDASQWPLWHKLYAASQAEIVFVGHSGFGGVCASYARKSVVINVNPAGCFRNPSLGLFGNVKMKGGYAPNGSYVKAEYVMTPCA